MAFYELTLFSTYFGQRCVNVFNFVSQGTPAAASGSFGLAFAFGAVLDGGVFPSGSIFNQLKALTTNDVIYNQVRVKNPYDLTDFYSVPFANGTTGEQATQSQSPAEALSVFSNQVRLDIQAGQKRFVGVPYGYLGEGGVLSTAALEGLQELCDRMSAPITYDDEGNTLTYNLVVAKKEKFTNSEGKPSTRYYTTLAAQMNNIASGILWTPRPHTSTQTTRQYGRGR